MPEIEVLVPKEDVQISEFLQTKDYSLRDTVDIEDGFSITYDGTPTQKSIESLDAVVQLSFNFNIELTDIVSQYLAYRCATTNIKIEDKEINNPTKEKIDEAFREAIEDE